MDTDESAPVRVDTERRRLADGGDDLRALPAKQGRSYLV